MTDVIVTPFSGGWTVRHPRRLHERFDRREDALRKASGYARQLSRDGDACAVREEKSFAPQRSSRGV